MHISIGASWFLENGSRKEIDKELIKLLSDIENLGSLRLAAEERHHSYRHAWGLIKKHEDLLQQALIKSQRGRGKGTVLTELGEKLVSSNHAIEQELGTVHQDMVEELNSILSSKPKIKKTHPLRVCASHGMAISFLHQHLQADENLNTDFAVHGSLESLRMLKQSNCDIAGFHYPLGDFYDSLAPSYKKYLNMDKNEYLLVATRQQGIMTTVKSTQKIKSLSDLTKRSVKFINRQHDSGTRTILDELLSSENINANDINGFEMEEFTHLAVAAMIASGAVNTGFGIKAAANQFNLNFIPIIDEAYVLAIDKNISANDKSTIKNFLSSKEFKTEINSYPGYNAKYSGSDLDIDKLFHNEINFL